MGKNFFGKKGNNTEAKAKIKKNQKKKQNTYISLKNRKYAVMLFIFLGIIISNNNVINCETIKLIIRGPGFFNIFSTSFNSDNHPNNIKINGKQNSTFDNINYFDSVNNSVELTWNEKINDSSKMFSGCSNIIEINLSDFDTSGVTNMGSMFSGCSQLSLIDLSGCDASQVTYINSMFSGCSKLEFINLRGFKVNENLDLSHIFENVPENIVICLDEGNTKIEQEIRKKACYTFDCSDNWKINQKKIINETDICFDLDENNIVFKYEYHGIFYENCINGNITNNSTINYCHCYSENCCSNLSLLDTYYEMEEDDNNSNLHKKCVKEKPDGYFFDSNEFTYKKCFNSCEECDNNGNNITHNCTKCKNDYPIQFIINNNFNCYRNCTFYYYFDEDNNYLCTSNDSCPNNYQKLVNKECKEIDELEKAKDDFQKCLNNKKTNEDEIKCYDTILKKLEDIFTSSEYNTSNITDGTDEIINIAKVKVIYTTTLNQKNNLNNNWTNIDLGDCEISLRQKYNISDDVLYIKILEITQEGMKIPKVEYDIYSKISGNNLTKLDLKTCQNNKITLIMPINNSDSLDKLNSRSGYYNDFCYTSTTESGTDITLGDRKNEFPIKTVCQNDCDFVDYNFASKRAKCSCKAKESSSSYAQMKIDKKKLLDNFKNIKNIGNYRILKCYKVLFCITGIKENYGFYILIAIIIFHIIVLFVFCLKKFDTVKNLITQISLKKIF